MSKYTIETGEREDRFIDSYLTSISWTQGYDQVGTDLDEDCRREAIIDALAFFNRAWGAIGDDVVEQAAHDFWLSRNGHGAGFWDRDPAEYGGEYNAKRLQAWAESFGEVTPFDETGTHQYD